MSENHHEAANILVRVKSLLPSLSQAEARVAREIIRDPEAASASTITQLAKSAGASEATVVRFCRSLGINGHRELRILAAQAIVGSPGEADRDVIGGDIPAGASMDRIIETLSYADSHAVSDTAAALDARVCEEVVNAIAGARRIETYGVAASGIVAADLTQKLHRIGCVAFSWQDVHSALTSTALLGEKDVAVGISHSGATVETVEFLEEARERGAVTVALTNHERSPLAEIADHVLTTAARETTFRSGATGSRIAQLLVVDCLFVGVASRRRKRATNALASTAAVLSSRQRPER
ncbi:MurR/RpiR family transcriptional regulator [Salininema proteolyticum]|uniref:MurR/RpiR family transcriptional regulator n=1 Tax=Salininema proteolyticum TaxID=1607685 RepID=A0ABV8U5G6_9ACTN